MLKALQSIRNTMSKNNNTIEWRYEVNDISVKNFKNPLRVRGYLKAV